MPHTPVTIGPAPHPTRITFEDIEGKTTAYTLNAGEIERFNVTPARWITSVEQLLGKTHIGRIATSDAR